jgi:hypothetical protein
MLRPLKSAPVYRLPHIISLHPKPRVQGGALVGEREGLTYEVCTSLRRCCAGSRRGFFACTSLRR